MKTRGWQQQIVETTERFLTWRSRRKLVRKEKQRRKNPIADWAEVILSAAVIVLLINQYFFQAYQIPSESMVDSLEIGDRIFVDKLVYGPELVPGRFKISGWRQPRRAEVIIFENPTYLSKGPVFDITQRLLYMLTFTLVDIDRDEQGKVSVHFLIKRAVGMPRDYIRVHRGNVQFRLPGEIKWIAEDELQGRLGLAYPIRRLFPQEAYEPLEEVVAQIARRDAGLDLRVNTQTRSAELDGYRHSDQFFLETHWNRERYRISPHDRRYGREWLRRDLGWYVAQDAIFPMGDNRDNSRDARFFHAVSTNKVLGRASIRFWPPTRLGRVNTSSPARRTMMTTGPAGSTE